MAYSRQRELIIQTLAQTKSHPTADEIYSLIKADYPGISLATVYRNLNMLEQNGAIMRVSNPHGADRFDAVNDGHLHMVCEKCGNVFDIEKSAIPDICEMASEATGHSVERFQLIFYGICEACTRKNNNESIERRKKQ